MNNGIEELSLEQCALVAGGMNELLPETSGAAPEPEDERGGKYVLAGG